MKIIATSNFDDECVNDILICENVNKTNGEIIVNALNEKFNGVSDSMYYYQLVENARPLYKFEGY